MPYTNTRSLSCQRLAGLRIAEALALSAKTGYNGNQQGRDEKLLASGGGCFAAAGLANMVDGPRVAARPEAIPEFVLKS